ncbi:MAG: DMT family transporter [Chloroflexota bacterium]
MKTKDWLAFGGLSIAWGSSFLWIKIALAELGPFTLVAYRLLFGVLGLLVAYLIIKPEWPKNRRMWWVLAVMAVINVSVPFTLISWGEQFIDSSMTAILNSSVPLFTAIIAHFYLKEERLSLYKVFSIALGFIGVFVLVSPNGSALNSSVFGQLAVLAAAIFYAFSAVFMKKMGGNIPPVIQALLQLFYADAIMWGITPFVESPIAIPSLGITWISLVWLGVVGSCIAYLFYFYLIDSIGATRATMVTYTFPVFGVTLGTLFLGEALDWRLGVGGILVLGSIVLVNRKGH